MALIPQALEQMPIFKVHMLKDRHMLKNLAESEPKSPPGGTHKGAGVEEAAVGYWLFGERRARVAKISSSHF